VTALWGKREHPPRAMIRLGEVTLALALTSALGCTTPAPDRSATLVEGPSGVCSELTRAIARGQGREFEACDAVAFRTLVPLGHGFLLGWTPANGEADLWQLGSDGTFGNGPLAAVTFGTIRNNRLVIGMGRELVLDHDQRTGFTRVFRLDLNARGTSDPLRELLVERTWSPLPGGRALVWLADDYLLEWQPGSGDYGVVEYRPDDRENPFERHVDVGHRAEFRRGKRLISLGSGRLLEWNPRGSVYRVWGYDLSRLPSDIFDVEPSAQGVLAGIGEEHELLLLDTDRLGIWHRTAGTLETRRLDPSAVDPLSGDSLGVTEDDRFRSTLPGFEKETLSNVRRLVIVFPQGRSFDAYFGRYCEAASGSAPECTEGPACCEAAPLLVGETDCRPLLAEEDDHVPNGSPACLVEKLAAWSRDELTVSAECGDPRDFACATAGDEASPVAPYHALAARGALADRYFASAADGWEKNLIYFGLTSSVPGGIGGADAMFVGLLLANAGIPFSIYMPDPTSDTLEQPAPPYYDASFAHFRKLEEFAFDVETEQLPPISVVLPGPGADEAPGLQSGLANGIAFTTELTKSVLASPRYASETLVLIAHLTSGGFYDHVTPPPTQPTSVDPEPAPYGPRVPFLALGPFARKDHVSHAELEHSSITAFIEWNWFEGRSGQLGGRDRVVNNLGSLLDPAETGVEVPEGPRDASD
jgi:hypothetical protein